MQLSKEDIKRWQDDLRSGNYTQARGSWGDLTENNYCCLSVLNDVTLQRGTIRTNFKSMTSPQLAERYRNKQKMLSDVNETFPFLATNYESPADHFMELNDTHQLSFNQIADKLDEYAAQMGRTETVDPTVEVRQVQPDIQSVLSEFAKSR